jgi:hypothetical protein
LYNTAINSSQLIACNNTFIKYNLKLQEKTLFEDLITEYMYIYSNFKINILNKTEPFFNDRCYLYASNHSFPYLTLRQRKFMYFKNYTSRCFPMKNYSDLNTGCEVLSISSDRYIQCGCSFVGEVVAGIFSESFIEDSEYNYDLLNCLNYLSQARLVNIGLIFTLIVFCGSWALQILFYILGKNILEKNLFEVITNDCVTLGFNDELFPSFFDKHYNNNIRFFQFQYENTIIGKVKSEMIKNDLCN